MISALLLHYELFTSILRVLILIWAPLYLIFYWYITRKADRENGVVRLLYHKFTSQDIFFPVAQILILSLIFAASFLHPAIIVIGAGIIAFFFLYTKSEIFEDALDDQINDDLSGVTIKRDKQKMPVRLEKIKESVLKNVEKEYYEEGEIGTETPVEWKWDIEEKEREIHVKAAFSGNRTEETPAAPEKFSHQSETEPAEELLEIAVTPAAVEPAVETPKEKKKQRSEEMVIRDAGPSIINAITNVKFYRKPLIEEDEEYTLFNMDTQKEHGTIQGELLQQLLSYTEKWDESFNNHDIYLVSGIDPYEEDTLSEELVTFIKDVLEEDSELQLRWVYRTSL